MRQWAEWKEASRFRPTPPQFWVNGAPRRSGQSGRLTDPELASRVSELQLLEPDVNLVLELTESVLLEDDDRTLHALERLKVRGVKSGRLIILGIRKKYRNVRRYGGLSAYLYVAMNHSAHLVGLERGELGWTLEDNAAINAGIRLMGGKVVKRYRIYERELA